MLISSLTNAGIKPLAVLGYSNPAYDNDTRPYSPAGRTAYANYAAAIADRYGAQLEYEIFNEYNHPEGFAMGTCDWSVSCYLPMLQAAEAAIHAEAPTAKVVLTGMAGLTPLWLGGDTQVQPEYNFISYNWLEDFLDAGGANYVDVFNIHNYTVETSTGALTFGNPEGDNEIIVQNVKSLLANYPAAAGKPLWLTETGWSTYPTVGVSETVQAAYLVRDAVLTLRKGLDRYEFYDLFDDSPYASPDGNWGMLRHPQYYPAIAPKPAFVAQAVLSRKLDGYSYSSSDSLGANVYSLVFTKSGSPSVRVMWTTNSNVTGVDVAATSAFNVTSTLGTVSSVTPSSGTGVIALSGNPVYVVGSSVSGVTLHSGNPSGGADLALSKSVVASSVSGSNVGGQCGGCGREHLLAQRQLAGHADRRYGRELRRTSGEGIVAAGVVVVEKRDHLDPGQQRRDQFHDDLGAEVVRVHQYQQLLGGDRSAHHQRTIHSGVGDGEQAGMSGRRSASSRSTGCNEVARCVRWRGWQSAAPSF